MNLDAAIKKFLESYHFLKNYDHTRIILLGNIDENIRELSENNFYTVGEAESIYALDKQVKKLDEDFNKNSNQSNDAKKVIKEYLDLLEGKSIGYDTQSGTIFFMLNEDNEVQSSLANL